jgi:radical SAM superfamily enzyme YgiQ (UPF0313 family)
MLVYDEPLYRPPSEAYSQIFQVTIGCSNNTCTFCGMYKMKQFRARPVADVEAEFREIARVRPQTSQVFLADGDALVLKTSRLLSYLGLLYQLFPKLKRVSSYASPKNLLAKSVEELTSLKEAGLDILYYGVESGDAELLEKVHKGVTPDQMAEGTQKALKAGLRLSTTVLLGLGGKKYTEQHALGTAKLLNRINPDFIGALTLMLGPLEQVYSDITFDGDYQPLDKLETLVEMRLIVDNLDVRPCVFRANHASNYLPMKGFLPRDKKAILNLIDKALKDPGLLRPEWSRGL